MKPLIKTIAVASLLTLLCTTCALAADAQQVRKPLDYRIVSFHRGRADKALIKRAAELGYNGVQFQLEGGNVGPLKDFAERNKKEGYIDYCHKLGMKVTLWVHEFSDIPEEGTPGYIGPVDVKNEKLWQLLDKRYDWLLGELLPDVDGLVLTVAETQIWATDTDLMLKIVDILRDKCHKYNKELIVRTFVHHPDQFESVMKCVKQLPEDVIVMSKCVPQDWQMRGMDDKAIGGVGNHVQIEEYDICGEYFLKDKVANCMPDILKRQFDYGAAHGIDGICVRVDRDQAEVLHEPSEVNLWGLGMFATGKTDSVDDVWKAYATARYGAKAADGVIKALKPTQKVIEECLNIGDFTYGDTRRELPTGDDDAFNRNWQNWRWDASYVPLYKLTLAGDPLLIRKLARQKHEAIASAQQSLNELEKIKSALDPADYDILKTKLTGNKLQLAYRAPMMLAYMRYRRILNTTDSTEKQRLTSEIQEDLKQVRAVAEMQLPPSREIKHLGRTWKVGTPDGIDQKRIREWADRMEELLKEQGLGNRQ